MPTPHSIGLESDLEPEHEPEHEPEPEPESETPTPSQAALSTPDSEHEPDEPEGPPRPNPPLPVEKSNKSDNAVPRKGAHGRAPGASNWAQWEDMALAVEVRSQEIWKFPACSQEATKQWNKIPDLICVKHPKFSCSVAASKAHFMNKLLKESDDERPDKATGEDVGNDQFSKLMSDLLRLFLDRNLKHAEVTKTAKSKAAADKLAGEQLRQAALENMYSHDRFTIDVTNTEGATQRKKGAQRHSRKRSHVDDMNSKEEDNENVSLTKKTRTNNQTKLVEMVQERNKADQAMFEAALKEDRERQEALVNGINQMSDSIGQLAETIGEDRKVWDEVDKACQMELQAMLKVIERLAQK